MTINLSPTVQFFRQGHETLMPDPEFDNIINAIRDENNTVSTSRIVNNFSSYVDANPTSLHLRRLKAEDFFIMAQGVTHGILKDKLLAAAQKLVDLNSLEFTCKQSLPEHQNLITLIGSPTVETAKDCFDRTFTSIETLYNNNSSFRRTSTSIKALQEEFGRPLLEGDMALLFMASVGRTPIDDIERYSNLQKKVTAMFDKIYEALPFCFRSKEQQSIASRRVFTYLQYSEVNPTPTTPISTTNDSEPSTPRSTTNSVFYADLQWRRGSATNSVFELVFTEKKCS